MDKDIKPPEKLLQEDNDMITCGYDVILKVNHKDGKITIENPM